MDEKICRLCLRTSVGNFPILEDDLSVILDDLFVKPILDVSQQQNVVCNVCRDNLQKFYNFKMAYADILDTNLQVGDCKTDAGVGMREIENKPIFTTVDVKNPLTCRFCTEIIKNVCFIPLNELKKNEYLVNMLEKHIPKLNVNNTENIISCESCHKSLEDLLSFIIKCFDVEDKVQKYTEVEGDDKSQIGLKPVEEFPFKSALQQKSELCNEIKTEEIQVGDQKLFIVKSEPDPQWESEHDLDVIIKNEEIEIKSEGGSSGCDEETQEHVLTDRVPSKRKRHQCEICGYETIHKSHLTRHMLTHRDPSEIKMLRCKDCKYATIHKAHLTRHMMVHIDPSGTAVLKCKDCDYRTLHKAYLTRHMVIHRDRSVVTMHKCEMCTYENRHRDKLRLHVLTHKDPSERRKHKCSDCAFEVIGESSLRRHRMMAHSAPSERKMHKCKYCAYETLYKTSLTRHLLIHKDPSERRKYKCNDCPFETLDKPYLKRHVLIHIDPSKRIEFKCDLCAYVTLDERLLRIHASIHKDPSERRKYTCKNCEYETIHKTSMLRHIVTHKDPLEVTIHRCELCAYETKHISDMKRHMKASFHRGITRKRKGEYGHKGHKKRVA